MGPCRYGTQLSALCSTERERGPVRVQDWGCHFLLCQGFCLRTSPWTDETRQYFLPHPGGKILKGWIFPLLAIGTCINYMLLFPWGPNSTGNILTEPGMQRYKQTPLDRLVASCRMSHPCLIINLSVLPKHDKKHELLGEILAAA